MDLDGFELFCPSLLLQYYKEGWYVYMQLYLSLRLAQLLLFT